MRHTIKGFGSSLKIGVAMLVAVLGGVGMPAALAADIYKNASDGGTYGLNSGSHWPGGTAPSSGNNYFTSNYQFLWNGDSVTFAGDSLTVGSGGLFAIATGTAGTATFSNGDGLILAGGAIQGWEWNAGLTFALAGKMKVTSQSIIQFGQSSAINYNLQSTITGSGVLGFGGWSPATSTLTVGGNNSGFSGGFNMGMWASAANMANATLKVNNANALGTGALTMTYGTVDLNGYSPVVSALNGANASGNYVQNNATGTSTLTVGDSQNSDSSYAGVLQDGGSGKIIALTKSGTGTLTLTGANAYTGNTTINGGALAITGGGKIYPASISRTITINSGGTLAINNWGWNGSLGQLNYNTGNLVIDGGTVRYTGNTGSNARAFTIGANGATLEAATSGQTWTLSYDASYLLDSSNGGALTLTGAGNGQMDKVIPGAGGVTKSGAGAWTLTAANTYSGTTTVSNGTLSVSTTGFINSSTTVNVNGGTLSTAGADKLADSAAVTVAGGTLTLGGNDTVGSLTMSSGAIGGSSALTAATYGLSGGTVNGNLGAGTITSSGNVTLNGAAGAGTVNVTAGTLTLGASDRLADTAALKVAGGTVAMGGNSDTVGGVQLTSGSITGSGGTLTSTSAFDLQAGSVSAILGGGVGLNKTTSGTVTLSGVNTYTGTTMVSDGTLKLTGTGKVSGALDIATGAMVDVTEVTGGSYTLGSGQALKGKGTVTGGLIMGSGSTLSPGNSTGTNYFNSALTLSGNANVFELVSVTDHDMTVVTSTGSLTLQNKPILDVQAGSLTANLYDTFTIFDNQSGGAITLNDTFWLDDSTPLPDNATFTAGTKTLRINYNVGAGNNDIVLTVIPEPGTMQLLLFLGTALLMRRKLRQPKRRW